MKKAFAVALLFSLTSLTVFAADPPTITGKEDWKKFSTPGAGHKALNDLAGKWKFTMKWWPAADAKPEESKGTSTAKWIMGGRFLQQDVTGKAMGEKFVGQGFIGFDNVREQYQTVWFDNMSTHMMLGTGTFDAATKTLKETGEYSCPMTGAKHKPYRTELKIVGPKEHTYAMWTKGEDGKEFKSMEITYKK